METDLKNNSENIVTQEDMESVLNGAELKIPKGTASGTLFRMKGKGLPHLNHPGHGDQFVRVHVQVPTKLSKKQAELLEKLSNLEEESPSEGLFDKLKKRFQ